MSAGLMVGFVFGRVVLDSLLIFVSMLIAVKGFDMGFGAFGPGILKILAVAMGPGALGQMVEEMMGGGFGGMLIGALVTLTLYGTLIKVLFNLDLGETLMLMFLIYGVRRVLGTFLFVALIGMASSGAISEDTAGAVGVGTAAVATAGDDGEFVPPKRVLEGPEIAEDLDKGAQHLLNFNKGGTNLEDYFGDDAVRRFTNMTHDQSIALVKAFKDAGAKSLTGVDFYDVEDEKGWKQTLVGGMVVEMPDEPAARKKVFAIRADVLKSAGLPEVMVETEAGGRYDAKRKQEAMKDWGQKMMVFHFGADKKAKYFGQAKMEKKLKEMEAEEKAQEAEDAKEEAKEKEGAAPAETEKPAAPPAEKPGDAAPF
jgi:hypothetical protein